MKAKLKVENLEYSFTQEHAAKFKEGTKVLAGSLKLPMRVVSFEPCIGGMRYTLAFYRKDGEIDKRRNYRFFFEKALTPTI